MIRTYAIAALAVLVLALGWLVDHQRSELQGTQEALKATHQAWEAESKRREASEEALAGLAKDRQRTNTIVKEVIREIPIELPAGTPDLPAGFRVLHDAAATGVLPAPAQRASAAPVAAQDAAGTINDNYAACRDQDAAYQRLQQWLQGVSR